MTEIKHRTSNIKHQTSDVSYEASDVIRQEKEDEEVRSDVNYCRSASHLHIDQVMCDESLWSR